MPDELESFYKICISELDLNIIGLMCIPPNDDKSNHYFSKMKKLKTKMNLDDLSMGMSKDYLLAVQNSSTYIRIGSKIFGDRI